MQDTEQTRIGYFALKRINYKLRETFEVIKQNPMDLNLLMEHIACLTSCVSILAEYLADFEDERAIPDYCPQCNTALLYAECSHCGHDTTVTKTC